jgi:uncharacterized membrane protein YkoI
MIMTIKFLTSFAILAVLITTTMGFLPLVTSNNVFAQTNSTSGTNTTDMTGNDMMMKGNYNNPMMSMGNKTYEKINGTINMMDIMYQAIQSKVNTTLTDAISTAEQSVGNNSYATSANGEEKDGMLVYSIVLGSPDMKFNKVLVDPGNGQILQSKEISMMDWMMLMHSGGHEDMKTMGMKGDHSQGKGMKGMHGDYSGYQGKYNSGW